MKYFAYGRKSTQDDTHQAQSIETQERILKDFVKQNNLDVVEYIYESRSAKDDGNKQHHGLTPVVFTTQASLVQNPQLLDSRCIS
jgi:DNA invertase Pin-like site-specific DNA recombinase